jgi:hypothetical protein
MGHFNKMTCRWQKSKKIHRFCCQLITSEVYHVNLVQKRVVSATEGEVSLLVKYMLVKIR